MSDLKGLSQERAEELAQERYNCGFYDLPEGTRVAIYDEAMSEIIEWGEE